MYNIYRIVIPCDVGDNNALAQKLAHIYAKNVNISQSKLLVMIALRSPFVNEAFALGGGSGHSFCFE